jgi:hypothetical protein
MCKLHGPRKHSTWRRKRPRAIAVNVNFARFLEQKSNLCREIPANVFARQEVTEEAIFPKLFFDPASIGFLALALADEPTWFGNCATGKCSSCPEIFKFFRALADKPRWFGDCAMVPVRIQLGCEEICFMS